MNTAMRILEKFVLVLVITVAWRLYALDLSLWRLLIGWVAMYFVGQLDCRIEK